MALVFLVTLVLSIVDMKEPGQDAVHRAKWLIYLTHWGYAICTAQSFLAAYLVTYVYFKQRNNAGQHPHIYM